MPEARAAARARREPASHVQRTLVDPDGRTQAVLVHLGESPLGWLRARDMLTERQFQAGERLREDWEKAGLRPAVTMRWDCAAGAGRSGRGAPAPADPHGWRLNAKERFDAALAHAGPGLADILWRVACAGEGLAAAERALGWPTRAGKLVLGFALDRVADHYRVA